tara:strand:- start:18 stop:1109 length:1092 start_codon:yes stop_codon:yes gene_type:complete
MSLKCGIVGLPNVGKSTLFNCVSENKAQSANFPFCTIEPNIGMSYVKDKRLDKLTELVNPERVIPTTIEIVDIAGLVKGANKGEGLGNKFLSNIRETDAIIHLVRCFDDSNISHVEGVIDPVRDKEIIELELQLKDLETIEKRIVKLEKTVKSGDKDSKKEYDILLNCKEFLSSGSNVRDFDCDDRVFIDRLFLLSDKPVLYVCNVNEHYFKTKNNAYVDSFVSSLKKNDQHLVISAQIESEISELETYDEKQFFLKDIGLEETGVNKILTHSYSMLNLITFFTAGPKEVKAWTISKGDKVTTAAGKIHSDIEKGFIKADVISYSDFVFYKSEFSCRENGKVNVEGKNYIVLDGDVIHFKFKV